MSIDITSEQVEQESLDFNVQSKDGRKHAFTLPVLGSGNIPLGMMATVSVAHDALQSRDDTEMARALHGLLESMRGQFPDQYRTLWSMDFETAVKVFESWFEASKENGFDPKA